MLVAAGIGGLLGQFWPALALCFGVIAAWQFWQLSRLLQLLRTQRRVPPPRGIGLFAQLTEQLHRRQHEARTRKRRLTTMLRAFRQAAASLPDAIVALDADDHRIEWFNEAAQRLLDLRYPGDLGRRLTRLETVPRVAEWLRGDAQEPLLDLPSPFHPGHRLTLRLLEYTPQQKLLVVRDVSKLMHLEQVRRDFVANVSHELRTPLTVVHGYLDMLDPDDMPDLAPMLREMRTQSLRMTQIVEDLLTISRLEAQERLPTERIVMRALLDTLQREARALSHGQHEIELVDTAGVNLAGSNKELHSAFSNLVSNAVRYTPAGGRVRLLFERTAGGGVRFAVEDTGHGIPAQHIPRITERFYRVSTSRSRESGGTGLGLSIVKHVLNLHGARLAIESEVGRGSTFACEFGPERVVERGAALSQFDED
ncbi:two-component system phosphate regulon sensor histidine kinase PhoR [Chiayiivirga flava]|uniref:Phosphate regulon sensor protein PhoR n=1 Tax=Chiayiivirga flava TaxID=659595 RepID=A0A7W8D316_9GAMM|nr:two-component system phosphate regulon sensor histidine kinase PhoR [Chiayiivirga flava]